MTRSSRIKNSVRRRAVSAGGVIVNHGRICLVWQRINNRWTLPKGHRRRSESLEKTARREIREETGLIVRKPVKKLGVIERIGRTDKGYEWKKIHLFLFRTRQKKLAPLESHKYRAAWFRLKDAQRRIFWKIEREFLSKHREEILSH
jgi:ADP-ribose pyrophosphatase YjhB (NUDIX family)